MKELTKGEEEKRITAYVSVVSCFVCIRRSTFPYFAFYYVHSLFLLYM